MIDCMMIEERESCIYYDFVIFLLYRIIYVLSLALRNTLFTSQRFNLDFLVEICPLFVIAFVVVSSLLYPL